MSLSSEQNTEPQTKCSCGHLLSSHDVSEAEKWKGKIFCASDNCREWNRCNIQFKAGQEYTHNPNSVRAFFLD